MLARLREDAATREDSGDLHHRAARQPAERERLMALGAVAVIAKPFYPVKLAETVRRHLQPIKLAAAGYRFRQAPARRRGDARDIPRQPAQRRR